MSSRAVNPDLQMAKRLIIVRKHLGLTQEIMSEAIGISQSMLSQVQKGTKELPTSCIKMLYMKYNISPNYLIAGIGSIEHKNEPGKLITDLREIKAELLIVQAEMKKMKSDFDYLTKQLVPKPVPNPSE